MRRILGCAGIVVLVAGLVLFWLVHRSHVASKELGGMISTRLDAVVVPLSTGSTPAPADLERLAADPVTRSALFTALHKLHRDELFPATYRTVDALAVSALTAWLMHPNELGAPPDEIELAEEVERPSSDGSTESFRVYRFRMHPPHWSAKRGWTAAVAGPYVAGSPEPTVPRLVFSTFTKYESLTAAEHVKRTLAETESATVRR